MSAEDFGVTPCPKCRQVYLCKCDESAEVGVKHDEGKPDFLAIAYHPIALSKLAAVLDYGARKYPSRENWRKVPDLEPRYLKAALRHVFARIRGEKLDPESGLPHLAHAMCCLVFLLEIGD